MKPEQLLVKRISNYLKVQYPEIPFRFDQIDQVSRQAGRRNKELHGKWSKGYPDLLIFARKKPLLIELKATKTVANTTHTRTQAAYHKVLRGLGYKVTFACGFEDAVKKIDKHMRKRL